MQGRASMVSRGCIPTIRKRPHARAARGRFKPRTIVFQSISATLSNVLMAEGRSSLLMQLGEAATCRAVRY